MGVKSALSQEEVKAILSRIEVRLVVLGMTKEEFYTKSGISSATYSYWNTYTYKPTPKKLKSAAEVLGVTYEYLVTGETLTNENKPATPEGSELSTTKEELWRYLQTASDEEAQAVLNLLKVRAAKRPKER